VELSHQHGPQKTSAGKMRKENKDTFTFLHR
jgi:hypothetical protein